MAMIRLKRIGHYKLIETKAQTKVLILDGKDTYAWINAGEIGEILVGSHKTHVADCVLSMGHYRLYDVTQEPDFSDQLHLELYAGHHTWQGYLLPTGLPTEEKKRNRIIPTRESITSYLKEKSLLEQAQTL